MVYNVNYDIYDEKGLVYSRRKAACFSSFYSYLPGSYKSVDIYVLKKYPNANNCLPKDFVPLTSEEILTYAKAVQNMGFKFGFREEEDQYVCSIVFADNSVVANKIIINAIRHIHEAQGPIIVRHFLRLVKQRVIGLTNFAKLQLACHCMDMYNYGHMFVPGYAAQQLLSKADFERYVLKNNDCISVNEILPKGKNWIRGTKEWLALSKMFTDGEPLKNIVKLYKTFA